MYKNRVYYCLSWIIATVLIATLSACTGASPVPGGGSYYYWERESNNSSSQANWMPLNYSDASDGYDYTGIFSPEDYSDDWFRLTTSQSGQLSVTLMSSDLTYNNHIYIFLYDIWLNQLDSATLGGSAGYSTTVSTAASAAAEDYFIRIEADSWTLRYDLAPSFNGGGGAFAEYWEIESNNSSSQADVMPLSYRPGADGYDFTGRIDDTLADWYRLTTSQYGQLWVTLTCVDVAYGENIYITLYDTWLNQLDARTLSGSPGGSVTASTSYSAPAGFYYVRIDSDSWIHRYDIAPGFSTY